MSRKKKPRLSLVSGWVMYLRTSDEDAQAPERSQAGQRRMIHHALIQPSGLPLLDEYVDNYTGRATDRTHYQRLLADAREGKFSHVAVAFADRFGRNDVEALRAIDELTALGVTIRIATDPSLNPADMNGRLFTNILFGMARLESDRTAHRVVEGMHSKLLSGEWAFRAPDGYVNKEIKLVQPGHEDKMKNTRYKRWIELDPEQAKVWRLAWDLLLTETKTLEDICEALHGHGYRLKGGTPFVKISPRGRRVPAAAKLSKAFHNWVYAGWIVLDTEWGVIQPKTVRGNWEPIVTTEEFERGMAILNKRNMDRCPRRKHEYLLRGLVYLQEPHATPVKLTCSFSNANRRSGGSRYYCIYSSNTNILCKVVDAQIPQWLAGLQVDDTLLPSLRQAYMDDVDQHLARSAKTERQELEDQLKSINEEETRMARQYAAQKLSEQIWEMLWQEWQDRRAAIRTTLALLEDSREMHLDSLDVALTLISKAAILFNKLELENQHQLLKHMVRRVIIDPQGVIVKIELLPPFGYLQQLVTNATGRQAGARKQKPRLKRGSVEGKSCSDLVALGTPIGIRTRVSALKGPRPRPLDDKGRRCK